MSETVSSGDRSIIGLIRLTIDVLSTGKITRDFTRSTALIQATLRAFATSAVCKVIIQKLNQFF